ncbi:response regulator [Pseudooceanicola spongiae]|uniref:Response regulator n=1 Tax=Pseudooceanicola spongiae TaxID=2613965 RepID=A0A7L9WKR3_9RHOB|nr:response regulator [Pseudooceanicola spongiae]QOL80522.1 response regulator [Pseudooceanicola spongiae]
MRLTDGIEALEHLRGEKGTPPEKSILMVDLNIPRMNGLEFLAEVRKDPNLHRAIAFIMTTSNEEKDKVAAYGQNIAGYILKNTAGEDFLIVIETLDHFWRVVEMPDITLGPAAAE